MEPGSPEARGCVVGALAWAVVVFVLLGAVPVGLLLLLDLLSGLEILEAKSVPTLWGYFVTELCVLAGVVVVWRRLPVEQRVLPLFALAALSLVPLYIFGEFLGDWA